MKPLCRLELGVSLVEMMVGLAIVGILATLALPAMQNMIAESRVSAQADQLVAILNQARATAIKERRVVTVCPAADANTAAACSGSAGDWSTGILISDATGVLHRAQVGQGLVLTSAATAASFRGTIGSAQAAVSWTICSPGVRQQQVDVSLVGRVSKRINAGVCQ